MFPNIRLWHCDVIAGFVVLRSRVTPCFFGGFCTQHAIFERIISSCCLHYLWNAHLPVTSRDLCMSFRMEQSTRFHVWTNTWSGTSNMARSLFQMWHKVRARKVQKQESHSSPPSQNCISFFLLIIFTCYSCKTGTAQITNNQYWSHSCFCHV